MAHCTPIQEKIAGYRFAYFESRRKLETAVQNVRDIYKQLQRLATFSTIQLPDIIFPDVKLYKNDDNVRGGRAGNFEQDFNKLLERISQDTTKAHLHSVEQTVNFHLKQNFAQQRNLAQSIAQMGQCPPAPEKGGMTDLEKLRAKAEEAHDELLAWEGMLRQLSSLLAALATFVVANPSNVPSTVPANPLTVLANPLAVSINPEDPYKELVSQLDLTFIALFKAPLVFKNAVNAFIKEKNLSEEDIMREYDWREFDDLLSQNKDLYYFQTLLRTANMFFQDEWFRRGIPVKLVLEANVGLDNL